MKNELNNEIKTRVDTINAIKDCIRKVTKARQLIVEAGAGVPTDDIDTVMSQYMTEIDNQKAKITKAKKKLAYLAKIDELDKVETDGQMVMEN